MKKNSVRIILSLMLLFSTACDPTLVTAVLDESSVMMKEKQQKRAALKSVGYSKKEMKNYETKLNDAAKCVTEIEKNVIYTVIDRKSPDLEKMTYKHFSDKDYITSLERDALSWYIPKAEYCFIDVINVNYSSPLVMEIALITNRSYAEILFLFASLDNSEISWGKFNREAKKIMDVNQDKINDWKFKVETASYQASKIYNIQRLQDEVNSLKQQRNNLNRQFFRSQQNLKTSRFRERELENEKAHLELCARYPGEYQNCPD